MAAPGFWEVARRPRWIGALLLCLAIAAAFAALGQWQLERSVAGNVVPDESSESVVPLDGFAEPGAAVTEPQIGQRVSLDGSYVAADFTVLGHRMDRGREGWWLVGHLVTTANGRDADLAVALGWAPTEAAARAAIPAAPAGEVAIEGRFLPTEAPTDSDFEAGERSALAVSELVNEWSGPALPVFDGYVIAAAAPAGLEAIDAPPPSREFTVNLLNVFYAIEWAIFAGAALYLWWRLVKDVVEAEGEEDPDAASETADDAHGSSGARK